jgi:hypothetical protein
LFPVSGITQVTIRTIFTDTVSPPACSQVMLPSRLGPGRSSGFVAVLVWDVLSEAQIRNIANDGLPPPTTIILGPVNASALRPLSHQSRSGRRRIATECQYHRICRRDQRADFLSWQQPILPITDNNLTNISHAPPSSARSASFRQLTPETPRCRTWKCRRRPHPQ